MRYFKSIFKIKIDSIFTVYKIICAIDSRNNSYCRGKDVENDLLLPSIIDHITAGSALCELGFGLLFSARNPATKYRKCGEEVD